MKLVVATVIAARKMRTICNRSVNEVRIDRPATACITRRTIKLLNARRYDLIVCQPTLIDRALGTIRERYGTFAVYTEVFMSHVEMFPHRLPANLYFTPSDN